MKTPFISLLAFVLCHTALAVPDLSIANKIGYAYPGTATIDGIISDGEWDAATSQGGNIINEFLPTDFFTPPTDAADLSGVWYALWDEEALYILLDIWDDELIFIYTNPDIFELFVSTAYTRPYGVYQDTGYDGVSDCHLIAVPFMDDSVWFEHGPNSFLSRTRILQEDISTALTVSDNGYRVEIKLPWEYIMGDVNETRVSFYDGVFSGGVNSAQYGHERNFMGFDIHLQDGDYVGSHGQAKLAWNSGYEGRKGDFHFDDPSMWGTLVLVPEWSMKDALFSEDPWLDMGEDFVFNLSDDQFYYIGISRFIYSFAEENWWYVHSEDAAPDSFFIYDFSLEAWFFVFEGFKLSLDEV